MRVGLLGRTDWLLATAEALAAAGHRIAFVQTCAAEPHYTAGEADFAALAARHGAPSSRTAASAGPTPSALRPGPRSASRSTGRR